MPAGVDVYQWLELFNYAFNFSPHGAAFVAFPDGRPMVAQPVILIDVFNIILDEKLKLIRRAQQNG